MPLMDFEEQGMLHQRLQWAFESAFFTGYVCALQIQSEKLNHEQAVKLHDERLRSRHFYASRYYHKRLRRTSKMARFWSAHFHNLKNEKKRET